MQRYRKKLRKQNYSQKSLKEKTTFSPYHSILVYFSCYHPDYWFSLISLSSDKDDNIIYCYDIIYYIITINALYIL